MGIERILLDTHALLWWWSEPEKLSGRIREILENPKTQVFVSAASAWEIFTKTRIGKLPIGNSISAQSIIEVMPLASRDETMDSFGVNRIW